MTFAVSAIPNFLDEKGSCSLSKLLILLINIIDEWIKLS